MTESTPTESIPVEVINNAPDNADNILRLRAQRAGGPVSLSFVIPCYNEEEVVEPLYTRLVKVMDTLSCKVEVVCVNDGSTDKTVEKLKELIGEDSRFKLVSLARNFGHQLALTCGLDFAHGEVVLIMDADLQDPPELVFEMLEKWKQGYDVVYGKRTERTGETLLKRFCAYAFYRIFEQIIGITVPSDTGDFRLMDRRAVEALRAMKERHRFVRGMVSWIGYAQTPVFYQRPVREFGDTKYPFRKSFFLAMDAITSFSYAPLRMATYLGIGISGFAFVYIMVVIALKLTLLFTDLEFVDTPGYTSIMASMLLIGGVQLIVLGVIGEYVGRIFEQGKGRPLYLVDEVYGKSVLTQREKSGTGKSS